MGVKRTRRKQGHVHRIVDASRRAEGGERAVEIRKAGSGVRVKASFPVNLSDYDSRAALPRLRVKNTAGRGDLRGDTYSGAHLHDDNHHRSEQDDSGPRPRRREYPSERSQLARDAVSPWLVAAIGVLLQSERVGRTDVSRKAVHAMHGVHYSPTGGLLSRTAAAVAPRAVHNRRNRSGPGRGRGRRARRRAGLSLRRAR